VRQKGGGATLGLGPSVDPAVSEDQDWNEPAKALTASPGDQTRSLRKAGVFPRPTRYDP